ncbi:choice-of-anchor P family protein [Kitasatospora sp. NPDC057965]|uniref:choice-of-anchor P family protein n=1 Tax=Kitasatospora sp. NPDC057965 TaxID=3346291 RepID=UPI0036D79FE7
MTSRRTRNRTRLLAGAALTATLVCTAAPAWAALAAPQAKAYVVAADAVGSLVSVSPMPSSTYPSGGTNTLAGVHLGPFATDSVLTATTSGDPQAGTSGASATVDSLGVDLTLATVSLTGVNSTCTATPTGATGSGLIAGGTVRVPLLPAITLQAGAAPNTQVNVPGVATIVLNEQTTDANGVLTVNAVRIALLPILNGANLTIGHAECGGAAPAEAVPMINPQVAAVGGAAALATAAGVFLLRRRNGAA